MNQNFRFIHLSDTHGEHERVNIPDEEFDAIFHTGDWANIEDFKEKDIELSFKQSIEFIDWFANIKCKNKIIVSGNHSLFLNDANLRSQFEEYCHNKGIIFLDDPRDTVEINGVTIKGCGAYLKTMDIMPSKWSYYRDELFFENIFEDDVFDIMLVHNCPTDKTKNNNDFTCDDLTAYLENHKQAPKVLLCGHVHVKKGRFRIKNTEVLNASYEFNPKIQVYSVLKYLE